MIEPPPTLLHARQAGLGAEHGRRKVGFQHAVPAFERHRFRRSGHAADPDIVMQDVEAAVGLHREVGHRLGDIGLGDVAGEHRDRAAPRP